MDINQLLKAKEATLAMVKKEAAILEGQIANLRIVASIKPTQYEKMVLEKPEMHVSVEDASGEEFIQPKPDGVSTTSNTERVRNPKGSIKAIALEVLATSDQSIDKIEAGINEKAFKPVSRASIRTLLMYLKQDGVVVSEKQGVFRLAEKSENPAVTGSSGATESDGSQP